MDAKELDSSSTHAIVQMSENDALGKSIRLVPCLWIAKTDDKWVCLYPQKKDSSQVETMVKESVPPRADFDRYDIKIVKEAKSFEEGERKLNRIFDIDNAETSSDYFANENNSRKRFRNSEYEESNEPFYGEDNSVYNLNSPMRITPDFSSTKETAEKTDNNATDSWEEFLDKKLQAIEARIITKLESVKRSISHEINKKTEDILNHLTSNTEASILENNDTNNAIGIKFPIENMEQFVKLSQTISQDSEKEKHMKVFLYRAQRGCSNLKGSLSKMLSSTMTKAIQLKFSGQGRKVKGKGKENFSATPLFHCIDDVLSNVFPEVGKSEILSATTRWFSGAADREGGKKLRSMDSQILPKSEQIDDPLAVAWAFT
ncbi:uncharacterized protein LOC122510721 [Leptopilina heterotoma]|uniref:uncharacterized protein LOC122510721 n=1 Tax=Leptopilina heterotoma TaxID=63436 RepID=UPI001CA83B18|nr:uncharacterized protein LOC122510721 [Leptopilina heterotoma]